MIDDGEKKVTEFEEELAKLRQQIKDGVDVSAAFVSMRSAQRTDEIGSCLILMIHSSLGLTRSTST